MTGCVLGWCFVCSPVAPRPSALYSLLREALWAQTGAQAPLQGLPTSQARL